MMCYVLLCYVIRILGLEELVTTNAQTIFFGIDPKCGLSTFRSKFKIQVLIKSWSNLDRCDGRDLFLGPG